MCCSRNSCCTITGRHYYIIKAEIFNNYNNGIFQDSITYGYGVIPILPIFKVKSNISPIFGSHEAITDGVYVMTWDNSYSRYILFSSESIK